MKFIKNTYIFRILFFFTQIFLHSAAGRLCLWINAVSEVLGEFTDNKFWLGGDVFFKYNLIPEIL